MTRRTSGLPDGLPPAADAYLASFPPGEVVAFPIHALDRTGVPVWIVALFLDPALGLEGAMPSGIGYGATDAEAVLGALGEIAEAIQPTLALQAAPKTRGSYHELVRALGPAAVADPLTLGLPAGSPVGRDTPLAWVEARRARDGATVLVPIDVAACDWFELDPGYEPFTTLITNGLGAGPDLDWAIGHGLLEILQRDGNGLVFRALDQGVALEGAASPLLDRFAALGIRAIPKFATDEFGLTNLYVVGHDEVGREPVAPICLSACGEACHPDRDAALAKAAQEFAAARVRKAFSHARQAIVDRVAPPGYTQRFLGAARTSLEGGESRALTAMLDWARRDADDLRRILQPVYATRSTRAFADLPTTPALDARERGRIARERVEAAGFDVLYVDCSPADRSVAVVKVIVPGLEVETMSYHRLGHRNARRLIERGSPLIRFGEPSDTLRPVRMPPEQAEELGQPLFDTAEADRIVGPLYPLYREPEAHHVAWVLGQAAPA
jgi:ribosomal protein S12 methylthiotransferase accessory factor